MPNKTDRQDELLRRLRQDGAASIDELARLLGASPATVRRDLHRLDQAGLLQRRAGRIDLLHPDGELPPPFRAAMNLDEKQRIACAALDLVQHGETILISGGTTTFELARLLPGRRRLTVITNALSVAGLLVDQPGINLVVLGGQVRPGERTMHGHLTESGAQELRPGRFFYSIEGLSLQHGLTHSSLQEVATDRALAASAVQVIVLADHSKFGRVAPAMVLPVSRLYAIVTGRETPAEVVEPFIAQGIQVIQA